jgi:nodulation protein E
MTHRVVVTGLGVVSPIGQNVPAFWSNLTQGMCGIAPSELVPPDQLATLANKVVAEVKDFDPKQHFEDRQLIMLDRVSQFAVVAAREAIAHAALDFGDGLSERTATIIGTGAGGQTTLEDNYRRVFVENAKRLHPLVIPKLMANAPASQVSMDRGLRGPAYGVVSACASATHAIGLAFHLVRSGAATCAVTGGAEACITFGTLKGWEALRVTAPDTCRPFSLGRKGLVLGEGAAVAVLETLEHASKRGAQILAEVVGFGMSSDAADLLSPDEGGMLRAINAALADAKLAPDAVQHINAHGTGTATNDEIETRAIKRAFGDHAKKLAITSNKSMLGHSLGAAGSLEFVATVMTIKEGIVPPTINYREPDPVCDLDYVPNKARPLKIDAALSNSFAFGGLNAVLAVKRF